LPFATIHNTRMFYRLQGNAGRPVLILSHSIGTDHAMWELQIGDLLPHFQILRYDTRGHGASEATAGEYSVELLGQDILALTDLLKISQFAFCGLSLGGAIGQRVAAHAPERVTHLVLANTTPQFVRSNWETRIAAVAKGGMPAVVDMAMQRFFSPDTLAKQNPHVASIRSVFLGTDPVGYLGCCAALRDMNHGDLLKQIKAPTLVISGDRDVSTPWDGHGERLAKEIPGAKVVHLAAAHLSNVERPHSFTTALLEFLLPQPNANADSLQKAGSEARRAVLGDAHVDKAIAATTEFTREFQELITRYAWGTIWSRPQLDWRTRRLLVLAVTASLGRWEEFALHLRAGLASDLELCDLKEVLLQTAVYAGVPAANTGFQIAAEQIKKSDR
jgi:3-oxoadipate enol-lactonase / 4-carboxymuconolactone decarboxylase